MLPADVLGQSLYSPLPLRYQHSPWVQQLNALQYAAGEILELVWSGVASARPDAVCNNLYAELAQEHPRRGAW